MRISIYYALDEICDFMDISVVGTGYVGIVTGACFSELANKVTCVDTDDQKVEFINKGTSPIHEPGLDDILRKNAGKSQFPDP